MSFASLIKERNFAALITANTILGTAFPIQLLLGGLAGLMLAPQAGLATLPASIQTLAGLIAAAPFSLLMGRLGRRAGFALGAVITLIGAVAAIFALSTQDFILLCIAHFLMGAGWASFQYFRFAASEAVDETWRPVAISLMLSSLLVAALLGPQIFVTAKDLLAPIPFAGAYGAIGAIALIGLLPLAGLHVPLPPRPSDGSISLQIALRLVVNCPPIRRAIGLAAISQGVMVFLMVPTPIAIIECGFSERMAGDVIRWHIVAMFAPSFFTGFLIKRFGVQTIAMIGLLLLALSAGAASLGVTAFHFYAALITLGVGWNFGFIGATTLLDAAVPASEKAVIQGANDTIIALVSTLCAFASGLVMSSLGWLALASVAGGMVIVTAAALQVKRRRPT